MKMRRSRFAAQAMIGHMFVAGLAAATIALTPAAASDAVKAPPLSAGGALYFGMSVEQVSQVLGAPLNYVRGRPGDELFLAIPNVKGGSLSMRSDALYLQFRRGKLTGWKGDWGTTKPWGIAWWYGSF